MSGSSSILSENNRSDTRSDTRSFSSIEMNETFQIDSELTVKQYLKKIEEEARERIKSRTIAQNEKLWLEFEREKNILLSEAASREEASNRAPLKIVLIELTSDDKKQMVEVRVGGDKMLAAKVGRSKGQNFKEPRGISLHWDDTVSTTHGHFYMKQGSLVFEDLGSTNKTRVSSFFKPESIELKEREPYIVNKDDVFHIGACKLRVIDVKNTLDL